MLVVFDEEVPTPILRDLGITEGDSHGGTIETSKVWAIDPGLVRQDRLPDAAWPRYPRFRVFPDPSPYFAGVMGDPKKASAEIGRRLLDERVSELVRIMRDAEREDSGHGRS
jgi:creatinine amidohydrolase/Fe(II)-dependent formamide hydrolase-like protein